MFISTLTITPLIVIVHLHMKKNPPSTVAIAIPGINNKFNINPDIRHIIIRIIVYV